MGQDYTEAPWLCTFSENTQDLYRRVSWSASSCVLRLFSAPCLALPQLSLKFMAATAIVRHRLCCWVVGEYVGPIYRQTMREPLTIIDGLYHPRHLIQHWLMGFPGCRTRGAWARLDQHPIGVVESASQS